VAVVDMKMPRLDAIEICERVQREAPGTAVVVYTGFEDPEALGSALDAGARGLVLKTSPTEDVLRAVRLAAAGGCYVDPMLSAALLRRRDGSGRIVLSPREREVLQLIAEGLTTDAAAWSLELASTTVRSYVDSAVQKLECRNRTEAVAKALRLELIR
jgi:two-component system response regulator DesR